MATTENPFVVSSLPSTQEDCGPPEVILENGGEEFGESRSTEASTQSPTIIAVADVKPAISTSSRPQLVQLNSQSGQASSQTKRFSAVNVTKKFLEKNSAASAPAPIVQSLTASKPVGATARSQTQLSSSYSRLVSAKLTSALPASSSGGIGWSRPSSTTSPNPPASGSPSNDSLPIPNSTSSTPGAPQLPHAGKVIQPQHRATISGKGVSSKDTAGERSNKPVWGNFKQAPQPRGLDVHRDFPTATEAAKGITSKPESKEAAGSAPSAKQSRMEEADTFRGVHLDPNAHHWDEMAEDDDNFLDGVIEFGDGRQYKIESTEVLDAISSDNNLPLSTSTGDETIASAETASVSKRERFVDDFDRTWPRSATSSSSIRDIPLPGEQTSVTSPIITQVSRSHQEPSRVLFNERSNRLEPYNNGIRSASGHHRGPQDPTVNPRETLTPVSHHGNVQDLPQSGGTEQVSRFRKFSSASSNHNRDKEPTSRWDGPLRSPVVPIEDIAPQRHKGLHKGAPPLPVHITRGHLREDGRSPPSHLASISPRSSPRDLKSHLPHVAPTLSTVNSMLLTPVSPALSHVSLAKVSPPTKAMPLPGLSAPELDEVQKDVMQSAAARAKQRRQQEEEEREREKERARRKAAELEERIKAEQAPVKITHSDDPVAAIIEETVNSVQQNTTPSSGISPSPSVQPPTPALQRTLSLRGSSKQSVPGPARRQSSLTVTAPAAQAESWRNKAVPPPIASQTADSSLTSFMPSQISALDHVETLVNGFREDLEVVDFSDLGKFVGAPEPEQIQIEGTTAHKQEKTSHVMEITTLATDSVWRQSSRRSAEADGTTKVQLSQSTSSLGNDFALDDSNVPLVDMSGMASKSGLNVTPQSSSLKAARDHRGPAISALDDTMSRIKGVIDGMQAAETTRDSSFVTITEIETSTSKIVATQAVGRSTKERWVPPALRLRILDHEPPETCDTTGLESPRSPRPSMKVVVRLPSSSLTLEPVSKKQLSLFSRPASSARWDMLSIDHPFERANRRDFSLNDFLYGRAAVYKGKTRYRIAMPRRTTTRMNMTIAPQKFHSAGAFGRPTGADGATTWRKTTLPKSEPVSRVDSDDAGIARSSLKDSKSDLKSDLPSTLSVDTDLAPQSKSDSLPSRSRIQPKMPIGSSVAFYRDSKIDTVKDDPAPSVKFIVSSELEFQDDTTTMTSTNISIHLPSPHLERLHGTALSSEHPEHTPALTKAESKKSDDSPDSPPMTPLTHHTTPWGRGPLAKDSPVRAPDPEHLKAVWSSTSDKAGIHSVNSLEAIPDDLTAIPFTIQEVKSEDGETPPPSLSVAPSRMSLHEVTKAFQQVPTSSSGSSPALHRTPPMTTPVMRPLYPNAMRPPYPYPPSIMNHAPPSNPLYPPPMPPSPIPSRMPVNGHAPIYSQPVWVPIPPSGPTPQTHGSMMRTIPSPYSVPLVPYPSAGTSGLYTPHPPANMQNTAQPPGAQVNRDRTVSMMSPVMSHAGPAMYGSPVLMHAPVLPVPQNHAYMVPTPSVRLLRTENGQVTTPHSQQSSNHEPQNYNPVTSFMRSTW